jgi:hypothetical protein
MVESYCQKCGAPNQVGALFCSKCGTDLALAASPSGSQGPPPASPSTPRKSHTGLIVIVVVVVLLLVVLVGLYASGVFNTGNSAGGGNSSPITITGFTFTPDYTGTTSGYLGSSYTCASGCPLQVAVGGTVTLTITLTSTASLLNHNIDDFTVTGGFTVVSVSPTLPVTLSPGASQSFMVTIQTPSVSGSYSITGTIVTN